MKTIFKYPISIGMNAVQMPKGAFAISAGEQELGSLYIWAIHDEPSKLKEPPVIHRFVVSGTGWLDDDGLLDPFHFLNTVLAKDGTVWHVFDLGEGEESPEADA